MNPFSRFVDWITLRDYGRAVEEARGGTRGLDRDGLRALSLGGDLAVVRLRYVLRARAGRPS